MQVKSFIRAWSQHEVLSPSPRVSRMEIVRTPRMTAMTGRSRNLRRYVWPWVWMTRSWLTATKIIADNVDCESTRSVMHYAIPARRCGRSWTCARTGSRTSQKINNVPIYDPGFRHPGQDSRTTLVFLSDIQPPGLLECVAEEHSALNGYQ